MRRIGDAGGDEAVVIPDGSPSPEALLQTAQTMLALLKDEGGPPETIAFWEQVVAGCQTTLEEKPK